jgi:hypothetical protein
MLWQSAETVLRKRINEKNYFLRKGETLKAFRKYRCHPVQFAVLTSELTNEAEG